MVDLIVDVAFVDLLLLMNISKKVYEAKLIASTYLKYWYSGSMLVPKFLEICQISVRNMSENCQLKKCVRKLSCMCQNSIRKLSDANICQKSIRKDLEIHQKCVRFYKCVRKLSVLYLENCLKSVRNITFDTFLTHLP